MLIIRTKQLNVMADTVARAFENRIINRLKIEFPERYQTLTASENQTAQDEPPVREWIEIAASFGIERENNINIFIDWMLEYGPDFYLQQSRSWVKEILEFHAWSEDGKIGAIENGLEEA